MTAAPSKLTPEQWKRVEDALGFAHGEVTLEIDEFHVSLQVQYLSPLKLAIQPFVNGWFRGEWLGKDCEERRRFFRPVVMHVYSPAAKAKWIKALGKKRTHELFDLDATKTYWQSCWLSSGSLRRHLIKHNTSIRLVGINSLGEPEL